MRESTTLDGVTGETEPVLFVVGTGGALIVVGLEVLGLLTVREREDGGVDVRTEVKGRSVTTDTVTEIVITECGLTDCGAEVRDQGARRMVSG
jgi:hypothetical protein